jgi:hypothetical protein
MQCEGIYNVTFTLFTICMLFEVCRKYNVISTLCRMICRLYALSGKIQWNIHALQNNLQTLRIVWENTM